MQRLTLPTCLFCLLMTACWPDSNGGTSDSGTDGDPDGAQPDQPDGFPSLDPNSDSTVEEGGYELSIDSETFGLITLLAYNVDTNWDRDLGLVFLSTDACNEPLGTLTMTLRLLDHDGAYYAVVESAVLSKTDVRVGTAEELNGVAWELVPPPDDLTATGAVPVVVLGSNFVSGHVELYMTRILRWPDDEPDLARVTGRFTAVAGGGTGGDPSRCE